MSFPAHFQRAAPLMRAGTVLIVMQMLARLWLVRRKDQLKASHDYIVIIFASTAVQWAIIIGMDRVYSYSPLSDTPIVLLLFVMQIMLQGTVFGSATSYCLETVVLTYAIFAPIVAIYVHLHEPPPGYQLLISKAEFFGVFCFVLVISTIVACVGKHTRRIHLAELVGLAEHYQRQRDRLQYELVYSARGPPSVLCGSEQGSHGDADRLMTSRERRGTSSYGTNSELAFEVPGGAASTYGTNSEIAFDDDADLDRRTTPLNVEFDATGSNVSTKKSRAREAALWSTLDDLGLMPKEHTD
jgi:hypothetical protein